MSNIREMQFGEILDGTFSIYRRHFGLFMRLSMIVLWVPMALYTYLQVRYSGNNAMELAIAIQESPATVIAAGLAWAVVMVAGSLMLTAGSVRIISDSFLGAQPLLAPALALSVRKIIPLLLVVLGKSLLLGLLGMVAGVVVVLAVTAAQFLGTLFAVLAGIAGFIAAVWLVGYVACGYGITTPTVVLEDLPSSFDSFGRSWDLTRGFRLKLFGLVAVTWLIAQFLPTIVVGVLSAIIVVAAPTLQPFLIVIASFLGIVLAPIMPCGLTLIYYDLRVRREAFDLQVLSQQLGIS